MSKNTLDIYRDILHSQGIQTLLFTPPYDNIHLADYGLRSHIYENYDYKRFERVFHMTSADVPVLIFQDEFSVEYCLLQFTQEECESYQATHLLLGPIHFHTTQEIDCARVLEQNHLPQSLSKDLLEFYNRIPGLPSRDFWVSFVTPLIQDLLGSEAKLEYYEFTSSSSDNFEPKEGSFSFETIEARYAAEKQLLDAVKSGNLERAIQCHQHFQQFKLSPRATDSLRSKKNITLTLNTLLRKTIESTHVHPYYIDSISSEFSLKIEQGTSESQLEALALQMIRKYCNLVKNYSTRNLSALVEKCVHQIQFHYMEPLSLEILANANAVSTSYLSALFHKETGSTITAYINETRINRSILLLNTTQLSIQEIASQCGFTDGNYYTRTFKKIKGITPMAYRKSIDNE